MTSETVESEQPTRSATSRAVARMARTLAEGHACAPLRGKRTSACLAGTDFALLAWRFRLKRRRDAETNRGRRRGGPCCARNRACGQRPPPHALLRRARHERRPPSHHVLQAGPLRRRAADAQAE